LAIKKIILPSTGIYQRTVKSVAVSASDPQSLRDFQDLLEQPASRDASLPSLDQLKDQAETFLRQYLVGESGGIRGIPESDRMAVHTAGIDYVVRQRVERAREDLYTRFQKALSQEENRKLIDDLRNVERASDACDMLHSLSVIRSQLKHGAPEVAVSHAISLGMAYERFSVRPSERKAWTGDKTLRAASSGGAARKKTAQDYHDLLSKFRASGLSQRAYARNAQISVSTLKRALKKLGSDPAN